MNTMLKRLQILQAALTLEDHSLIDSQRAAIEDALPHVATDDLRREVNSINQALARADYPQAQSLIAKLLAQASTLTVREDDERAALKLQLAALEQRCAELNQQHDEITHHIEGFNRTYSERLGDYIVKILKLQMMIAHYQAIEQDDTVAQATFEQARQHYREFHQQHQAQLDKPPTAELNADEQQRLKMAYRRASRLCHPDMVSKELKEQATKQFQALSAAYRKNDLATVEQILATLQSGGGFVAVSEQVDDKATLHAQIATLQQRITELEQSITELQTDETWQLIQSLTDKAAEQAYFAEQEQLLNAELQYLQNQWHDLIA